MISYEFGMLTQIDCGCFFFLNFSFDILFVENGDSDFFSHLALYDIISCSFNFGFVNKLDHGDLLRIL